jgi:hypothetical protein
MVKNYKYALICKIIITPAIKNQTKLLLDSLSYSEIGYSARVLVGGSLNNGLLYGVVSNKVKEYEL